MNRRAVLLGSLSLVLARPALSQPFQRGGITVDAPWAKPSVTEAAAVFMTLRNDGPRADRLIGGATPIAERVILRELDGSLLEYFDLLPRRPVFLKPGRRYIALRGLKRLLAVDDTFPLTLRFAEAGTLDVTAIVAEGPDDE
jgi:copper(I)-binding protein